MDREIDRQIQRQRTMLSAGIWCNVWLTLAAASAPRSVTNQRACSLLSPISSSPRQRDARRHGMGWW